MDSIQKLVGDGLRQAGDLVADGDPAAGQRLHLLAGEVDRPCVVAVVGRVNSGKSSLVNMLLGQDAAVVGTTETTATITHFTYGSPPDPARPVLCVWQNGEARDCGKEFLDSLQGHDEATLRLASGISRLEFRLQVPFLAKATIVDTPGTGAVVAEHETRSMDFLHLERSLRERHDQETRDAADRADAAIYITNAVGRASDKSLLESFHQATLGSSKALNAVGVIAKIDSSPDVLRQAAGLAADLATNLRISLGAVVPVSTALHKAAGCLARDGFKPLVQIRNAVARIPENQFAKLMSDEEMYLELDCPVPQKERARVRALVEHWPVFAVVAGLARDVTLDCDRIVAELERMSGRNALLAVLEDQFFTRGHVLRCSRILHDASAILADLRYRRLPSLEAEAARVEDRARRFREFVLGAQGDGTAKTELLDFIDGSSGTAASVARLRDALGAADEILAGASRATEELHADFDALSILSRAPETFTPEERDELHPLFGRYGLTPDKRLPPGQANNRSYVTARQMHWNHRAQRERSEARRQVADRALTRYGLIAAEQEAHDVADLANPAADADSAGLATTGSATRPVLSGTVGAGGKMAGRQGSGRPGAEAGSGRTARSSTVAALIGPIRRPVGRLLAVAISPGAATALGIPGGTLVVRMPHGNEVGRDLPSRKVDSASAPGTGIPAFRNALIGSLVPIRTSKGKAIVEVVKVASARGALACVRSKRTKDGLFIEVRTGQADGSASKLHSGSVGVHGGDVATPDRVCMFLDEEFDAPTSADAIGSLPGEGGTDPD